MPSLKLTATFGAVVALVGYSLFEEDASLRGNFSALPVSAFGHAADGRQDVYFPCGGSDGLRCHAWFFPPRNDGTEKTPAPLVVMGHGFGAQKDFGLPNYANKFADAGVAALVFDYRHWGGSEGQPRHLLEISLQLEDWYAALDYALDSLNGDLGVDGDVVNTERVGIWGSSFAGGHVIAVAGSYARKDRIKAVVSQVPYSDGLHTLPKMLTTMGLPWALRLSLHSVKDMLRRLFGMSRHYMPIIDESLDQAAPQSTRDNAATAVIATPECSNYWRLIESDVEKRLGGWQNRLPASIALEFPFYRPVTYASEVRAPTLGIYADGDSLCPVAGVKAMFETVAKKAEVETRRLSGGHFEAYLEDFEQVVQWEADFLVKHL